jgi:alkylation response protein AidB-like acyl-CoA dehydrogenase
MAEAPGPGELARYRAKVRAWLAGREFPRVTGYWLDHVPTLQAWQRELHEGGLVGISYPKEYGGEGLTLIHQAVANDEIMRRGAPTPIGGPGVDVVGPVIVRFGTEEQRRTLLGPLLSGDELWSLGFSEPEAGSDLASVRTTAVPDGDGFVLDGSKIWTGFAAFSTWALVIARTDPDAPKHRGLSFFAVRMDSPGLTRSPVHEMTGEPDAEVTQFYRLAFEGVRLPPGSLVGELNGGWECVLWALGRERGPFALRRLAELGGHFKDLLASVAGRSLSESQVEEVGRLAVLFDALRAQAARTARRVTEHPGEDFAEDSADRLLFAYVDQRLHHLALELLGPYRGYRGRTADGLDAHKYAVNYMYSRAGSIYSGTDQIQKNILAVRKLGLPRG